MVSVSSIKSIESLCFHIGIVFAPSIDQLLIYSTWRTHPSAVVHYAEVVVFQSKRVGPLGNLKVVL